LNEENGQQIVERALAVFKGEGEDITLVELCPDLQLLTCHPHVAREKLFWTTRLRWCFWLEKSLSGQSLWVNNSLCFNGIERGRKGKKGKKTMKINEI